jgi:hypothetical protein
MSMADTSFDDAYDGTGKSAAEIEQDIGRTRAELGATLDALERRLAPRHILEKGFDMVKETMSGNGGQIGETLRNHPLPLALIGVGLGWMAVSTALGGGTGAFAARIGGRVADTARTASEKAGRLAAQGRERLIPTSETPYASSEELAGYAYARTKPRFRVAADAAMQSADRAMQRAGDRVSRAMDDYPLVLGLVGLLAGAAIALMVPDTSLERRWIGPTREQLRNRAAALGRDAVDRAQRVAETAVDAVAEGVKSGVREAGEAAASEAGKDIRSG